VLVCATGWGADRSLCSRQNRSAHLRLLLPDWWLEAALILIRIRSTGVPRGCTHGSQEICCTTGSGLVSRLSKPASCGLSIDLLATLRQGRHRCARSLCVCCIAQSEPVSPTSGLCSAGQRATLWQACSLRRFSCRYGGLLFLENGTGASG